MSFNVDWVEYSEPVVCSKCGTTILSREEFFKGSRLQHTWYKLHTHAIIPTKNKDTEEITIYPDFPETEENWNRKWVLNVMRQGRKISCLTCKRQ